MASPQSVTPYSDPDVNALLTGYRWDTTQLTYSFPDSGWWYVLEEVVDDLDFLDVVDVLLGWLSDPVGSLINLLEEAVLGPFADTAIVAIVALNDFGEFNAAQQAAAETAHKNLSSFSLLKFTEVEEGDFFVEALPPDFGFTHGTIRYAETGSTQAPAFGIPPLPRVELLIGEGVLGDTWFDSDGRFDNAMPGNFAAFTILHETGHALGLKHAHEEGLFGGRIPEWLEDALTDTSGPIISSAHNSLEFTAMTYVSRENGGVGYTNAADSYPTTFMMYDILAIQHMYGANYDYNSGNTVYSWDPNTGEFFIDGAGQGAPAGNKVFMTIWDGNGIDTYDLSNYTEDAKINLNPGLWSVTSDRQRALLDDVVDDDPNDDIFSRGTVFNSLLFNNDTRSMIENANGGSGDDEIVGNDLANVLNGNAGNDTITGGLGNDTIDGGADDDTIDGGADNDSLTGGDGNDSITGGDGADTIDGGNGNDTILGGAGIDLVNAGAGNDSIDGGSEDDDLRGDDGNDTIVGGDGNDKVFAGTGDDSVQGGSGNDTVMGGDGADTIDGGDGDDLLAGELGNDSIVGGGGNDSMSGADGSDTLVGGAGIDTLDGGAGFDFLDGGDDADLLNAGDGNDTVFGGGGNDTITAGDGDDSIFGGTGLDSIDAGNGNDTVFGGGDADTIIAGAGLDVVSGGDGADYIDGGSDADDLAGDDGNDTILGGLGADTIAGGAGADSIDAGDGSDSVSGDDGDDTILGGLGADTIAGGAGADSIDAGADNDSVSGGDGNDTVFAGAGDDTVAGDGGNDLVHGGDGVDSITGGAGDDDLFGEGGNDSLYGDDGNDTLAGGAGADLVNGGAGIDMASYSDATGPVVINLQDWSQTTGDAQGDILVSIEQFGLSNFDDTFIGLDDPLNGDVVFGRGGNDTLLGFAGDDELYGEDGDDYIVGGPGADIIDGGNGFDTTSFLESKIGIIVDLTAPERNTGIAAGDTIVSIEQFHMTNQNDEFVGLDADETIYGYHGNDTISGNGGDDLIYGGGQHDLLSGGVGNDILFGEAGNDTLLGGDGNDSLDGGLDADDLQGGAGNDLMWGGQANDRLTGGAGDDLMWGGDGRDTFVYGASGWGRDTIWDFEDRTDRIEITGLPGGPGVHAMDDLLISERLGVGGFETVIRLAAGGADEIVLVGIRANQINHQDFVFYS